MKTAISPTRSENYPEWYQQVIKAADLAEISPVRGCMIIKPWGYALWEAIQKELNIRFQETGVENIYCPLFIPMRFLEKEAEHVDGFAKECAVVTHHRLEADKDGKLQPAGPLTEPLVVRPTSETLIGDMFSKWIASYRDLPILVNQWANIVRWEMRTRMFLRTTEFLWQEGHTAHASSDEAVTQSLEKLDLYADFCERILAMPVIKGEKSEMERFPGALNTYCVEAMMQDGKALQAGTSHFLGQNFAKAFNIEYLGEDEQKHHCWTTSWGVSTRLIGGLIMTHSDDDGLRVPPRIAPKHVVILPIMHNDDTDELLAFCQSIEKNLKQITYHGEPIRVVIDKRPLRGGEKAWSWVKKGAPIRLEIGRKELEQKSVFMGRRDLGYKEKTTLSVDTLYGSIESLLDDIQLNYKKQAEDFHKNNIRTVTDEASLYDCFKNNSGFVAGFWHEDKAIETQLKKDLSVTVRCFPLDNKETGPCIFSGKTGRWTIFAKAY
ncbi:MAG: proline--tRNA ligase [Pseudomonadota bacterium]|nr:proline--tRNA ligase [Pseudomonadota bacterium]